MKTAISPITTTYSYSQVSCSLIDPSQSFANEILQMKIFQWPVDYENLKNYILQSHDSVKILTLKISSYMVYLFYIKQWFTKVLSFHFQTKENDTCAKCTLNSRQAIMTETSKTTNFLGPFCFMTCFYKPFLLTSFLQVDYSNQ